jgi:uroporphyrin-III C-methyltransferase/precorrin-2 dehydrogenase/sirohydrochlorin ferrochelatase
LRQARLLGEAETLLLDGPVSPAILARARADASRREWNETAASQSAGGLTLILRYCPA